MTRQMYTCEHGRFVKAPKGYYRLGVVVVIGTVLLALNVAVSGWFAFVSSGVTL